MYINKNIEIWKSLILINFKRVYLTWTTRLIVIFSPTIFTFVLAIMLPFQYFIGISCIFAVPFSACFVFGLTYFPYKNSTINNNLFLTKVSPIQVYTSILAVMFFVTAMSSITMWTTIIFLEKLTNLLRINFVLFPFAGELNIVWSEIEWIIFIYYWIMSVLLIFFASILFRNFFKNEKKYFIVLLTYFIFLIGYGGLVQLNPFVADDSGNIIQMSALGNYGYYNNEGMINKFSDRLNFSYVVSLFTPQYYLSTMLFEGINSGVTISEGDSINWLWNLNGTQPFNWSIDWKWNLVIIMPFFYLTLIILLSIIFYKKV